MDDVHLEVPFDELRSSKLYKVLKNPTDMPSGFPKVDQMFKVVNVTPDRRYVTIMAVPRGNSELMMQMEHNTYPERSFVLMNPPAAAAAGGRRRRSRRARRRTQSRRRY
jgi:hypothetical protein